MKNFIRTIFLLIIFSCVFSSSVLAEMTTVYEQVNPVKLSVSLDKDNIKLAKPFYYLIDIDSSINEDVKIAVPNAKKNKTVSFISAEAFHDKEDSSKRKYKAVFQATTFKDATIPPLNITINGQTSTVPGHQIDVKSNFEKAQSPTEILDILPIEKYFILKPSYFYVPLAVLLGFAVFIALIVYLVRKLPKFFPKKEVLSIDDVDPYLHATEQLGKLRPNQLDTIDDFQLYYLKLSTIIRMFLEQDQRIPALESTTQEIISVMADKNFTSKEINMVKSILTRSDLVKFAEYFPSQEEAQESLDESYKLLDYFQHHHNETNM